MALLKTNLVARALASQRGVSILKGSVPAMDKFLLRITRGWLSSGLQSVALIETTGAKSGISRNIVTLCMPHADNLILVGSNWGQSRHPAWYFNLKAQPQAKVTFRGYSGPMIAGELHGEQRNELWQRLVAYNPQYQRYQSASDRLLPVIQLSKTR